MQSKQLLVLVIVFLVTQINPLNLVKLTLASTESSVEDFQDAEQQDPIEIYKNFTDTIFSTISELGENSTDTNAEVYQEEDGSRVASLIGVSYILAGANDLKWSISYPAFDNVMLDSTLDILGAMDFAFQKAVQTLKCTNVMFLSTSLNLSVDSEMGKKKSFETIPVDFDEDDVTAPFINDKISGFVTANSFQSVIQQNYIQEGLLISSSTVAILFNIVETNKLKWETPWNSIGKRSFNKKEQVDMLEFQGNVKFIEDETEIQLFILFENKKCGLALRMSKDISDHQSVANIEDMDYAISGIATVQLPSLNYTLRSEYNFNQENTTSCDFENNANYLQLLDVLAHVYIGPEYFELVAISGAQINNVEQYKEEVRRDKENSIKAFQNPKSSSKSFKSDENLMDLMDTEYLDVEDSISSSEMHLNIPSQVISIDEHEGQQDKITKRIIFDRPFTWMFFDDYRVPIAAGSIVVTPLKMSSSSLDDPQPYAYLGMETSRSFPYIQCFCMEC